jgi:hypothetical protein
MEPTLDRVTPRRSVPDLLARGVKGLGHASTFWLLALPFVLFSTCGGPEAEYTGYEALRGIPFRATDWGLRPGEFSGFGPDWWVAGIMVIALLAIAAAVWGGVRGAFAGIALVVAGTICVAQAVSFFQPPPAAYQWSPQTASGSGYILLIYVGSILVDLGWLSGKSWTVVRRGRGKQFPHRGEWMALGILSTGFLVLIGLVVFAGLLLLVTRS